ncbi:class I SAM-dependent methyltransferase [Salinispira pacifica]|uniref:class I SAM-dependent methyltransferase n=1 Tax=Salinispira pacifica TaxID=1307761 RepID=UPI00146FB9E5|nr:class I SAM-dependent methyltransferase [Salinispira pacifica]
MKFSPVLYNSFMRPLEHAGLRNYRKEIISRARGRVLEIGAGTGNNRPYYNMNALSELLFTDYEPLQLMEECCAADHADVQSLHYPDNSFDTVVATLVFCSVPDVSRGLAEIRRVLKPGGRYLFIEHVASCSPGIRRFQTIFTPLWRKIAENCHLDRDTLALIRNGGFQIDSLKTSAACMLIGGCAYSPDDASSTSISEAEGES